jgi:pSer/pThr/pTyr-binding forkhead associated (FHA) protein
MQSVPPTYGSEPTAQAPTAASAVVPPLEADQIPPNAPRTLAAFLVSYEVDALGQFWPLHQGATLLGRKDAGAGAPIEIDHPTTSSRHARIYAAARPGRIKIEDLGSTNGTYVNERRLEPGERRALVHGDSVRFGGYTATVVLV